jgi:hypothetical protein
MWACGEACVRVCFLVSDLDCTLWRRGSVISNRLAFGAPLARSLGRSRGGWRSQSRDWPQSAIELAEPEEQTRFRLRRPPTHPVPIRKTSSRGLLSPRFRCDERTAA